MATANRGRASKSDKEAVPKRPSAHKTRAGDSFQVQNLANPVPLPDSLPATSNNLNLRQKNVLRLQRKQGNARARSTLPARPAQAAPPVSSGSAPGNFIQRDASKGGKSKGEGPGTVKGASEDFYDVNGKELSDLTNQLKKFEGYASETYVALTIDGEVVPKKKGGKLQIKVKWKAVDHETRLPRWADYKDACPAAQKEWDRFMKQTRKHEAQKHVKMANKWVKSLGKKDTVITGDTVDELKTKLADKHKELAKRLQTKHDDCGHGVEIDAILHTDKGVCSK
jgi:predicted secreted Zn-dependent protease